RRKRNIDLSRFRDEESSSGINWGNNKEPKEEIEFEEEIEEVEPSDEGDSHTNNIGLNAEQLSLNGKPFRMKTKPVKQPFTETHVRVTTYLEKNVHQIIHMLQKQGQIESITKFINDSVKDYLINHYEDKNE